MRVEGGVGAVNYLTREGDYEDRHADLEHVAGDPEAVRQAAGAVDAAARVRRGRTAERILVAMACELPADSTAEQRAATAEALVADWRERGYEAVAAVHAAEGVQPHIPPGCCRQTRPAGSGRRLDGGSDAWLVADLHEGAPGGAAAGG